MCCSVLLFPNEKSGGKKSFTVYISVFHGEPGLFKAELETWVWCTQVTQRVLPGNLQKLNVPADVLKASRKRQDRFQLFSFNVTLTFRFSAGSTVEKHSGWRSWQKLSSLKSSFHAALAISVPALRWSFTAHEYYREMRENRRWRCAQRKLNTIFSRSRTLSAALMIHLKQFFSVTFQWMWMWTADRIKPATSNHRSSSQTLVTNWTASTFPSSPAILFLPVCISSFLSCHRFTLRSVSSISSISRATGRRRRRRVMRSVALEGWRLGAFARSHFLSALHALIFTPTSLHRCHLALHFHVSCQESLSRPRCSLSLSPTFTSLNLFTFVVMN